MPDPAQPAFRVVEIDDQHGGGGDTPRTGRYARLRQPKAEVRRCGRCGKDAVICCQAWVHSMNGVATGAVTRECRCQACGANVTLRDPTVIRTTMVMGFIFLIAIIPGLVMLAMTWRWRKRWDDNPLVDAPRPEVRHWRGPGNRRCGGCGQIARLVSVTRHTHNGMPTGTDCEYACAGCKREFTTESAGGVLFGLIAGAGIAAAGAGWFFVGNEPTPWRRFGAPVIALLGLWLVLRAVRRIGAAIANPRLDGEDAAA